MLSRMIRQNDFTPGESDNHNISAPSIWIVEQLPDFLLMPLSQRLPFLREAPAHFNTTPCPAFRKNIIEAVTPLIVTH
jgi:hypothetical protein